MNNIQTNQISFKWTSRIIGYIWIFLTGCFAILNIFIFIQPQWIGDTLSSPRAGYFGLYSYCVSTTSDYEFDCQGLWLNFEQILSGPFVVATFFVGLSAILILVCLILFSFFLCIRPRIIYFIGAIIQIICSICLLIALIVYPAGFDNETIRKVCGSNVNDYYLDKCQIRWGYILAIISFFDITILAILGFILGLTQPRNTRTKEMIHPYHMRSKYGELNEIFDDGTFSEPTTTSNVQRY